MIYQKKLNYYQQKILIFSLVEWILPPSQKNSEILPLYSGIIVVLSNK